MERGSIEEKEFAESRKSELEGLLKYGTFVAVDETEAQGKRVFGSRFVEVLKKVGDRLKRKSRLVAQNYSD